MELFFLCTIIMAAVSFISIALSQPPVNFALNVEANEAPSFDHLQMGESASNNSSFAEYQQMREMASMASY